MPTCSLLFLLRIETELDQRDASSSMPRSMKPPHATESFKVASLKVKRLPIFAEEREQAFTNVVIVSPSDGRKFPAGAQELFAGRELIAEFAERRDGLFSAGFAFGLTNFLCFLILIQCGGRIFPEVVRFAANLLTPLPLSIESRRKIGIGFIGRLLLRRCSSVVRAGSS